MTRSKLVAIAAALALPLGACADDDAGGQAGTDGGTAEDILDDEKPVSGDLRGMVTEAQPNPDGTVDLTIETDEGTVDATATTGARFVDSTAAGDQEVDLVQWLEDNEFDRTTEYTFVHRDEVIVEIRE